MNKTYTTKPGIPLPLGAYHVNNGVQFAVFSRNATSVILLLFESAEVHSRYEEIVLDPVEHKTGDIWHIFVEDIGEGQFYGYRFDGPYDPQNGHRFNKHKLILDPYAKAITGNFKWDITKSQGYDPNSAELDLSFSRDDNVPNVPRCIVINNKMRTGTKPLRIPQHELIIYELHVRGFTIHETSAVKHKGTYAGLMEKIPYLKELGVNAVELMPIQEFDEYENVNLNPLTGEPLKNYWGYSTLAFFAVKGSYAASGPLGQQVEEFKDMIDAFHEAGMEVILDVVFNHTAEGDHLGPTVFFKGIDNSIYYILEENKRFYKNYSGCGNTVNCNHPLVRDFILDCLRYWVVEMRVDGFRFDLASILGRDQEGNILSNPPLIERIEDDPILRNTKIIAEAWDAAGAYQVGSFPGRWAEWNGKYRDDVRSFWRGEQCSVGAFATRITGSADLYSMAESGPVQSINFITCHDGFTLNDLVSYNNKHNLANGENNLDGENYNLSMNMGIEGNSATTLFIEKMRNRQIKNFLATLFLSQGIPMLLAGDEFRRTQQGNNNCYCQDNELSWINWELLDSHKEMHRFTMLLIEFRKQHPVLRNKQHFTGKIAEGCSHPDISWHGCELDKPDWGENSHSIALLLCGSCSTDADIYIIFNASMLHLQFKIPASPSGCAWKIAVDTSQQEGRDIYPNGEEPTLESDTYYARKLSTVVLVAS